MDAVRSIRKERGWSQQRLATEAGINKVTLVHIETGKTSPNVETLGKLAGALGVELGDFFPKAQAPLPLEEYEEQRSDPLLQAWASHLKQRASLWRRELEKKDEMFEDPRYVSLAIFYDEIVQTETNSLLSVLGPIVTAWHSQYAEGKALIEELAPTIGQQQRVELLEAILAVIQAAREWGNRATDAYLPLLREDARRELSLALEARLFTQAREAAEESRDIVAMFENRLSA